MSKTYTEPQASFLVLDYQREASAQLCLESIRRHVKFPTKVIYCHNGMMDYPMRFLRDGLIDELIMPRENGGLGLGTRSLFAACFSPLAIYWQGDQIMGRDFEQTELDALQKSLEVFIGGGQALEGVLSISLAGAVCGENVYSERAHIIHTEDYRGMEHLLPLSHGGAGPYHDVEWREGQIQRYYKERYLAHYTGWRPFAIDNGRDAIRQNPDGSRWMHYPDTKQLWLLEGPVKERFVYPKFNDAEWDYVLREQTWPGGRIPENEVAHSFRVWN
jgi:hypothetical protein